MTDILQQKVDMSRYAVLAYESEMDLQRPGVLPPNVTIIDRQIQGGFAAYAFKNNDTGQVVIAFRGTDTAAEFFKNIPPILGVWDSEINMAASFVDRVRSIPDVTSIVLTGHSRGGMFTQEQKGSGLHNCIKMFSQSVGSFAVVVRKLLEVGDQAA